MAVHVDHLQALIDRGDVYHPSDVVSLLPPTPVAVALPRSHQRLRVIELDAVRLLAASGLVAWSIVALETWMLVR